MRIQIRRSCLKCSGSDLRDYTMAFKGKEMKSVRKQFKILICGTCGKEQFIEKHKQVKRKW